MKNDLKTVISQINNSFISEARNSISLIEDMAAMEKYMAESYGGRVFIELVQNADDCESQRVSLCQIGKDLFFANNGRSFDSADIMAICRSGSSYKKRGESIGYRGVGFKSTISLTNEVLIYSSGVTFSFSKKHAAEQLGLPIDSVPTVRIPFLINDIDQKTRNNIHSFVNQHYSTIFVFKNANINSLVAELSEVDPDTFLFLRSIEDCYIDVMDIKKHFIMSRKEEPGVSLFQTKDQQWRIYRKGLISLAFKEESGRIVPCTENEGVYHCYLPTLDKTPFLFKINADFSTDPSRKHIAIDDTTNKAIESLVDMLCDIIEKLLNGNTEIDSYFLTFVLKQHSFSILNQRVYSDFRKKTSHIRIKLGNGTTIQLASYKCLPDWLDPSEKRIIRMNSTSLFALSLPREVYSNYYEVDEFISTFSDECYGNDDLISLLDEKAVIDKLPNETIVKLGSNIIKKSYRDNRIYGKTQELLPMVQTLQEKENSDKTVSMINPLLQTLSEAERKYLEATSGIHFEVNNNGSSTNPLNRGSLRNTVHSGKATKPSLPRWRTAEQRVVLLEKSIGNNAIDVSRMNIGYDVESTTPTGEKRYIEVKALSNGVSEFSMTNNEYTAAHQNGKSYYICLVFEDKALYICDPLKNLVFVKRARQWEWVCDEYFGEEIEFNSI